MIKTWNVVIAMWRPLLTGLIILAGLTFLMVWRLGSVTPGVSPTELEMYNSSSSLSSIIDNAVNAPYKTAVYLSTRIFDNPFGLRLPGAIIGMLAIVLFYTLASRIMTVGISVVTTVMFATTSLFLVITRTATPNVMLLALLALLAIGAFIRYGKLQVFGWLLASATVALSLYTPGMLIFVLAGTIWQFKRLKTSFEELQPAYIIACAVLLSVLSAPLIISLIRDPGLWREFLGLPDVLPNLKQFGLRVAEALASLFIISPKHPEYWLGRQPVLDVFSAVIFIYGTLAIRKYIRLERLILTLSVFILTMLWIALTDNLQALMLFLPIVYIVIGLGLQDLLNAWMSVFPRNPIARTTGTIFLVAAIVLSINFQTQRYFIAWSNSPETTEIFSHQLR